MIKSKDLYEKRNASDAWEGFPEVLVNLIQNIYHSYGEYSVGDTIKYLQEYDAGQDEHKKLLYLMYTDRFFKALYPMFAFGNEWKNTADLESLLQRAEGYLIDIADDYEAVKKSNRTELGFYDRSNLVCLSQSLEMYFATLYWHQSKVKDFEERLNNLLGAEKRNLSYMLSHADAAELRELDFEGMDEFYTMDFYYWRPIVWVLNEGGAVTFPERMIDLLEDIVGFLYDLDVGNNWKVRNDYILSAESDLQWCYRSVLDRRDEGASSEPYDGFFDECEYKLYKSEKRVDGLKQSYASIHTSDDFDDLLADGVSYWQSKWDEVCDMLHDELGMVSYRTWIEPLILDHVDERNDIMYLIWPNQETLLGHIEQYYLARIEAAARRVAPEIERIVIVPCSLDMLSRPYHRKWRSFTNSLRELMEAYPSLPVVVFRESDEGEEEPYIADISRTECVEGYAYDTEEFTEKIIAIYVKRPKKKPGQDYFISDEDIPF